jgi:alcohol dehydrogenase class IV
MSLNFEFATATKIIFGAGKLRELGSVARRFGQRVLLVTGRDTSRAAKAVEFLTTSGIESTVFPVIREPEISTVEQGVLAARNQRCDVVIGLGGGSVLDAAKAIAAMMANEGEVLDYVEIIGRGKALTKPSIPFIAIPTTAGTGSEVTRNAVLASPEHRVKASLRSELMLAKVALVDPELTYDLPPELTATTGLDALTQLIEPYVCSRANPMTDGLCIEGIKRVAGSLPLAFSDGRNKAAREEMAVASLFGGLALANAGLGAVHGFAGPIGGMFPAPHGGVCAALLPHVMAMNVRALRERAQGHPSLERYQEVARLLAGKANAPVEEGIEWVQRLIAEFGIPKLSSYEIKQEHVGQIVEQAMKASSMKANPIMLTNGELVEVLQQAI